MDRLVQNPSQALTGPSAFPRALQFQLPREQGPHWKEVKVQSVAITGRYSYASNSDQKSGCFFSSQASEAHAAMLSISSKLSRAHVLRA